MGVMTCLLLLLWAGVAVSTLVDLQKRIIGGQDCAPTKRLYHVEVRGYRTFPGTAFTKCGGSLISNQWILTAEHCWDSTRIMRAVLGIHPGGQGTLEEITPHFFQDNQTRTHDIMLLQLKNPTQIQHIDLPECGNRLNVGDTVEVAGRASKTMGLNNERQRGRSDVLQCVNIAVQDCQWLKNCRGWNSRSPYAYQHWQCYQSPNVDTSAGDSGGGVVFNNRIYGVHVFTSNGTHACVAPAGFMDVCAYMDWIEIITSIARPTPRPRPGIAPTPAPRSRSVLGPGPTPAPRSRPRPAPTPAPRSRP